MSKTSDEAFQHLVLVAAHAIFVGDEKIEPFAATEDQHWLLAPYQKGEPTQFVEHIRRGVELTAQDPEALILFSGGATKRHTRRLTEADGYLRLARTFDWWGSSDVAHRAETEPFARDSFENLLFGICRFFELAGRYPALITLVSWPFKRERFEFHSRSIGWPLPRLRFEGVGNPARLQDAESGEKLTLAMFRKDPYGIGPELLFKRRARTPFGFNPGYARTNPSLPETLLDARRDSPKTPVTRPLEPDDFPWV